MNQLSPILFFILALIPLSSHGQLENYEIEFPWKHRVSRLEMDDTGYYWLHDDKDFFYYNGHQIIATGLGDLLGRKKNDYFFTGDLIKIDDEMVFTNDRDISLFNPRTKQVTPKWRMPDGDEFYYMYEDDLGEIWLFCVNAELGTRPVYRATEGLDFEFAFDLYPHLADRALSWDFELTDRNGLLFIHPRLGGLIILDERGEEVQLPVQNLEDYESKKACSQFRLDNQNNLWRIYNDQFEILDWKTGRFRRHGLTGQFEFITDCKRAIEVTNLKRGLEGFGSLLNLRSIYTDSKDRIWMSCATAYLVMYDPVTDDVLSFRKPIVQELEGGDHDIYFVFEDGAGNIWGNQKGGLFKIRDKESYFTSYAVNTGDADHPLYKGEDQATITQAIDHYNDYAIRNATVHGIGEDEQGYLVFQEGVFTYQVDLLTEEIKVLPIFNPKEKVHLTVEDDFKVYASWGSYYSMDQRYDVKKHDHPIIKIENIFRQSNGDIWFSGVYGQQNYMFGKADPETLEYQGNYENERINVNFNTLPVKGVSEDEKGLLWIASSGGIYTLNTTKDYLEKWEDTFAYNGSSYTIGVGVNQLLHLSESLFWFKSDYEYGLLDVETKAIIYLRKIDTEVSGDHLKILPIDESSVWVGDQQGVSYVNFENGINITLSLQEGIDTRGAVNVMRKLSSGLVAVGTNNGCYVFNPEYVLSKTKIRESKDLNIPLYVNSYSYVPSQGREVTSKEFLAQSNLKIELEHDHRDLAINVSINDFDYPTRHIYRHKLEGFDTDWSEADNNNIIYYTSLPPGDYRLLVEGSASGGLWSNEVLEIDIVVTDVWYKSWWFLTFLIMGLSSLVYFVTNYFQGQKLKRQLAIAEVRDRISKDLHDDVGTILTGVAMQSELLEDFSDEKNKPLARQIAERSREAMGRMRDTVWAIDSRKDSIVDLKDRMMDFLEEIVPQDQLQYSLKINAKNEALVLPPDIRQAVYLIFKESIVNIVKHSDTAIIEVHLSTNKDQLNLHISDEGTQKERIKNSGQGLSNMKSRAELLQGTYSFIYDNGYQTKLQLPLK